MDLTGEQKRQLRDALLSAFPSESDLAQMVAFGLNQTLAAIGGDGALDAVAFNLVTWAVAQGRVGDLVEAALKQNAQNPQLQAVADSLDLSADRRQAARAAYAATLERLHGQMDLRVLLPKDYESTYGTYVRLRDVYVPGWVTLTRHQRARPDETAPLLACAPALSELRPLSQALVQEQAVLVLMGNPGSGMSMFLRYLALTTLDGGDADGPLPILVALPAYAAALQADANLALRDFAAQFYTTQGVAGASALFAHAERTGQALYLLDGLSEVPSATRGQVSDKVVALATTLGAGNRLVMSTRCAGYIPLALDDYGEAMIQGFNSDRIAEFVERWHTTLRRQGSTPPPPDGPTTAQLLQRISNDAGVARLAANPRTLTIILLLFFAGKDALPSPRIKLYEVVTRTLLEDLPQQPAAPPGADLSEATVMKQLGALAYWLHDQKPQGAASREEVLAQLAQDGPPTGDLVALYDQAGLLTPNAQDEWGFRYVPIEEYLAAREIASWRRLLVENEIARRAPDPRWTEVIRLAVAQIGAGGDTPQAGYAADLVKTRVLERPDAYEPYLHRNLLLAGRVLADSPELDELRRDVSHRLLDLLLTTLVEALADSARAVLLEMKDTSILPDVAEAICARRGVDRLAAFATMPEIWDGAAGASAVNQVWEALVSLLTEGDGSIRALAAEALAQHATAPPHWAGENDLARALRQLGTEDDAARIAAIRDLTDLVDQPGVRTILVELLTDSNSEVCAAAVSALGACRDASVCPILLPRVHDRAWCVREAAARALKSFAAHTDVVDALAGLLIDEEGPVRAAAADALANTPPNPDLRDKLIVMLHDPATAAAAFTTLARWAEADAGA